MPGVLNMYKKSILFEIVDRNNPGTPIESFTLTIPPESMEIEEEQRINETATFGGVFLDDYGEGVKPISISGNTGGSTLRKTYSHPDSRRLDKGKKFSGSTAFFYFRNNLMRYKNEKSKRNNYQNYDIYIYDLSTIPTEQEISRYPIENIAEGYVCYLKKFKMTRNKERPLFYNYSIELVSTRALGSFLGTEPPIRTTINPFSLIGSIRRTVRLVKGFFTTVQNAMDQVTNVLNLVDDMTAQLNAFIHQTGDLVYYPFALATRLLSSMINLSTIVEAARTEMIVNQGKIETTFIHILSVMREGVSASGALVVYGKTSGTTGREIRRIDTEKSRAESNVIRFTELSEDESEITSNVLAQEIDELGSYRIYGYLLVTADQSTTLDSLSMKYFGSVEYMQLIALFNEIKSDGDIISGETIKIPVLVKGEVSEYNFIYSEKGQDVYGSDIRLDSSGKMVVMASGDIARISGPENLVQAVNLRLNDRLGSRLRLTLYGIRASIGFAMGEITPISYIVGSLRDTLMQEPRIDRLDDIRLSLEGDKIWTNFKIYSIKVGEAIPYRGGIF